MNTINIDSNKVYSYADYLLWQFKERVELIKGKLFKMSPAPSMQHQRVVTRLIARFSVFLGGHTCEVFTAPFDVRLPKEGQHEDQRIYTVVQPDVCVICDKSKLDKRGCVGAPDLVVEVLSPGNTQKEMDEKFEIYEESGVREYWLVNFIEKNVLVYVLNEQGKFIGLKPFTENTNLTAAIFPEMSINLKELFAED